MKKFCSLTICLILLLSTLFGCGQSNVTKETADPMIHNLNKSFKCTVISPEGTVFEEYSAQLVVSITDYATKEDSINITLPLSAKFEYTSDHENVTFTIEQEDQDLPYYCMKAYLYHRETDSLAPFDFAIDLEKEIFILKPASADEDYYIVASSNGMILSDSIIHYFSQFLEIYDYSE